MAKQVNTGDLRQSIRQLGFRAAELERKSRGITSAHGRAASLERQVADLTLRLDTQIERIDRMGENAGQTQISAIMAEIRRIEVRSDSLWSDMNDQLTALDTRLTAVDDRLGCVENNRALAIDFDRSTNVPVSGQLDRKVNWLLAVIVGTVSGVVSGLLASQWLYDYESFDWSKGKSIAAGVIIGLATALLFASFERLTFAGNGTITWVDRPTLQDEADRLRELTLDNQLDTPPATMVQPAVVVE